MKTLANLVMLCSLLLPTLLSSAGEIYKWTDKDGVVHFGDHPPGQQNQNYSSAPASSGKHVVSNKERRAKQKKLLEAFAEDNEMKKKQNAEKQQQREKRIKNCNLSKDELGKYQRASRIYSRDKLGNRQYMNQQQRKQEIQRMQTMVDKWCK